MPFTELDELLPGWRRVRNSLLGKSLVEVLQFTDEARSFAPDGEPQPGPRLNVEQSAALDAIRRESGFHVSLLDGVTGSGKTEVYMSLIADVLARGQQALVLVPEIGLTPQLLTRIRKRLGTVPALLHSSLTDSARLAAWRAARDGSAALVLGTRSAVFAPLANPGLIVVDEEHDSSLKQQEGLKYSARDLAVARAKHLKVPIVLGSATPSLESLQRCNSGAYQHLILPARAGNAAPPLLRLVDISASQPHDGLSEVVVRSIEKNLSRGGQSLLFLNRRGFAPTLICGDCGKIAECNRCDARMTVHASDNRLMCHHCAAIRPLDSVCASCGGPCRPLGQGTERLEDALRARFPAQQIARIDSDTTRLKGTMDKALAMATSGETRILVGTQMLSKGHHFPNLTLVVIINADQGLFSTDFRGSERLAQSLVQVAGRAGRERMQGEVIIQTAFPQHPFWHELIKGGYQRVSRSALAEREATAWPPFSRLALLRAAAIRREDARQFLDAARQLAEAANSGDVRILGPVSAPMERRKGRYRSQLLLQSVNRQALHRLLRQLRMDLEDNVPARRVRWSIDVDPVELF
jgi:primosomal protein N' (replication factor Y)